MRREQVLELWNLSDEVTPNFVVFGIWFSEIGGSREKAGNVTNQKLWNVPQISNSVQWSYKYRKCSGLGVFNPAKTHT